MDLGACRGVQRGWEAPWPGVGGKCGVSTSLLPSRWAFPWQCPLCHVPRPGCDPTGAAQPGQLPRPVCFSCGHRKPFPETSRGWVWFRFPFSCSLPCSAWANDPGHLPGLCFPLVPANPSGTRGQPGPSRPEEGTARAPAESRDDLLAFSPAPNPRHFNERGARGGSRGPFAELRRDGAFSGPAASARSQLAPEREKSIPGGRGGWGTSFPPPGAATPVEMSNPLPPQLSRVPAGWERDSLHAGGPGATGTSKVTVVQTGSLLPALHPCQLHPRSPGRSGVPAPPGRLLGAP